MSREHSCATPARGTMPHRTLTLVKDAAGTMQPAHPVQIELVGSPTKRTVSLEKATTVVQL